MNRHIGRMVAVAVLSVAIFMTAFSGNVYASKSATKATNKTTSNTAKSQTSTVPKGSDVTPEAMHTYVSNLIASITTSGQTKEQKLAACYNYCLAHMKYKRDTSAPNALLVKDYALEAFYTGRGNCYRYASMFAYMATELGYNVQIQVGQCTSDKGGWTPHGWCVITHDDGTSLIYDLSFGDANIGKKNYYGITAAEHARALKPEQVWTVIY